MQADIPAAESAIREIPLSTLALAPENARKTPADQVAHEQIKASIAAHGLLENLVFRPGNPDGGGEGYAVVAGGRRLSALKDLAEDGAIAADHPVPCLVVPTGDGAEVSLAENAMRVAMHPADQVEAFAALAEAGLAVPEIAARFGASERVVEQRLRLGNAAPELLAAFRAGEIGLEALQAFAVTTDHGRQLAVWEQVSQQPYHPSAWQIKRLLTDERVPGASALARYVGVEAYGAAGGAVLRDLFADGDENGVWLEDAALLEELAQRKLQAAADELSTRWKWAEARLEVDWGATARFGRIRPAPGQPTDEETAERKRLMARHDELANLDEEGWTEELETEAEAIEFRLAEIKEAIATRATFARGDFSVAGCIATVGRDGKLELIQGLVRPEDMPEADAAKAGAAAKTNGSGTPGPFPGSGSGVRAGANAGPASAIDAGRMDAPAVSPPQAAPIDAAAKARDDAGVGIGLADDLRAIRTALVKTHLAGDFDAAFDLAVFQFAQAVFAEDAGADHALDIACKETPDRPPSRANHDAFANWSPGEAALADRSGLPLAWMDENGAAARFDALRKLPRAGKEKLFAAAVARTLRGQLAFEHGARPEFEATAARLGIDFARQVRPTADLYWSRLRKDRVLDIAKAVFGPGWAQARSKYKKAGLAKAMEEAFAAGTPALGVDAESHSAALAWTPPGFEPFGGTAGESGNDSVSPDAGAGAEAPVRGEAAEAAGPVNGSGDREAQSGGQSNGETRRGDNPPSGADGEAETPNARCVDGAANGSPAGGENGAGTAAPPANGNGGEPHAAEPAAAAGINGGPPAGAGVDTAEPEIPAFPRNVS